MAMCNDFPEDFQHCIQFHGHVCPGLAIGYAAARAGLAALKSERSQDEELVAIVENDSCAVDAIQALLGCTFGKGNLIFRDWGKQVFTFIDRKTGRAVRVSFTGRIPEREERQALRLKKEAGTATDQDKDRLEQLGRQAVWSLISSDPTEFFAVREIDAEMPPFARIVTTRPCDSCGELTMTSKLRDRDGKTICAACGS
jgi:formylmethanofuran dehydrogenase subunit E